MNWAFGVAAKRPMDRAVGVAKAVPFSGMTCRGGAGLQPAYEVRMLHVMIQCRAGKWNRLSQYKPLRVWDRAHRNKSRFWNRVTSSGCTYTYIYMCPYM